MWKLISGIKSHPRDSNRRQPNNDGIFHAREKRLRRNTRSPVASPVAYRWPTIIAACSKNIEFISTVWALLRFPELAGFRVDGQTVSIPVAQSEDSGLSPGAANKRIVFGDTSIIAQSDGLTCIVVQILRAFDRGV